MAAPLNPSPPGKGPLPNASDSGGGDKKDAGKFIKSKTPKNASGSLKKALDASKNLKKSKGNPKMQDAVGMAELASMMAEVASAFSAPAQNQTDFCEHAQEQLTALQVIIHELQATLPQTQDLKDSEKEVQDSIDLLITQMKQHGCPINGVLQQPNG